MTDETIDLSNLDDAIAAVYRGAAEDFVRRRDALAKQLRAEKRREDADRVKALRKPSRAAWALNNVLSETGATIDELKAAVQEAQEEQARGGGQLRAALESVRSAAREVAHAAARASIRVGQPVDAATLVPAVNAVIGDATAFAELRAGRLTEIPEAGGLDFMTAVSAPTAQLSAVVEEPRPAPARGSADEAARVELEQAEATLHDANARTNEARTALSDARARLAAAEEQLQRARRELKECERDVERAQKQADEGDAEVHLAQHRLAELQARAP